MCKCKWHRGSYECDKDAWEESKEGYCIFHEPNRDAKGVEQFWGELKQDGNFVGYHFPPDADFADFPPFEKADFLYAHFHGNVDFSNAIFKTEAIFIEATFYQSALFRDAEFHGDAETKVPSETAVYLRICIACHILLSYLWVWREAQATVNLYGYYRFVFCCVILS